MPQTYKGVSIPAYSDTADGPAAFRNLIDGGGAISRVASGQKPAAPVEGQVIWNTTDKRFEYWNGSAWTALHRGDGGPRGYITESVASGALTIANSAGFTTLLEVTLTGMTVGRRIKFTGQLTMACGATTDPQIAAAVTLPNSNQTSFAEFGSQGAGFFRASTAHAGTWVTTGASQTFRIGARVKEGNPWTREGAYLLFEDIGPA